MRNRGIAWEAGAEHEEVILSQKFVGEQSLCFALLSGPPEYLSAPLVSQF